MTKKEPGKLELFLEQSNYMMMGIAMLFFLLHFTINSPDKIDMGLELGFTIAYIQWLASRLIVIGLRFHRGALDWFVLKWAIGIGFAALVLVIFLEL